MKEADIRPQELFNRYLALVQRDTERLFADRGGFVAVTCPACGEAKGEPALSKQGFSFSLCACCGSLYLTPRPTPAMYDACLRESEAAAFWATDFYRETAQARRAKLFRPRARLVCDLTKRFVSGAAGRFVDVGAGYGLLLEEVRELGCFAEVIGIEPSPALGDVCRGRGFRVVDTILEEVGEGALEADFATAFEVLEHVFDPLAFLRAIRRLLRPGGVAMLTTLSVSGFDIQVLWEHSKAVYAPYHINLLSIEGFGRLAERAGLEVLELSTPGRLDVDIVRNTLAETPSITLEPFLRHLVAEAPEETRAAFQTFLSDNRLSSHVRLVVRRPLR